MLSRTSAAISGITLIYRAHGWSPESCNLTLQVYKYDQRTL